MGTPSRQIDAFVSMVTDAKTRRHVWSGMELFCHQHDFSSVAYILASNDGQVKEGQNGEERCGRLIEETSNLDGQFDQDYAAMGAFEFDPFLVWGCQSFTPQNFGAPYAGGLPKVSKSQIEFLDYAAASGIQMAFGVPVSLCREKEYGGWIVGANNSTLRQFEMQQVESSDLVRLAALIAHERMEHLRRNESACQLILSPRERECLIWLSLGLRTSQIADKLGLSVSAVRLYHSNARKKLGAKTREHAVALAIVRGEVIL